jgi:hypothetical protein
MSSITPEALALTESFFDQVGEQMAAFLAANGSPLPPKGDPAKLPKPALGKGSVREIKRKVNAIMFADMPEYRRASYGYYNVVHRKVAPRPRAVCWSAQLQARIERGDLPADEVQAIRDIAEACEAGADINPHQSTGLTKPLYNDGLFNDWGITHLHFGLPGGRPAPLGFVNRSDRVLLVMVRATDVLFLDVYEHHPEPWSDRTLLEIVLANWPQIMAEYRQPGVVANSNVSEEDYQAGRDAGLMQFVVLSDGFVYLGMGRGYAACGLSTAVTMATDDLLTRVRNAAIFLADNSEHVRLLVRAEVGIDVPVPQWTLVLNDNGRLCVRVREETTGLLCRFQAA